jgi:hypothetical protein
MRKLTLAALVVAIACCGAVAALLAARWGVPGLAAIAVAGALGLAAATIVAAGIVVGARQRRVDEGAPDLFLLANEARSESSVRAGAWRPGRVRRWIASTFGHRCLVGDTVRVKPLEAIRATLDADGCVDGLPFMDEMARACGRTMRVYRVLDKIYDYGRSRLMRRIDGCVLLIDARCDGSAHDGCEADCYLIWKTEWLEPVDHAAPSGAPAPLALAPQPAFDGQKVYRCQYTMLTGASRPMPQLGFYAALGPWAAGNVTAGAFLLTTATAAFNALQEWRGGATYPAKPTPSEDPSIRGDVLQAGDWARVKLPPELARAMNRQSKHRGLWFDRDMLKFTGGVFQVRRRVERIIDIHSGRMIAMKTPCIALEDVHLTGEFQCFGEQHDFLYWREAWLTLERRGQGPAGRSPAAQAA